MTRGMMLVPSTSAVQELKAIIWRWIVMALAAVLIGLVSYAVGKENGYQQGQSDVVDMVTTSNPPPIPCAEILNPEDLSRCGGTDK